MNNKLRFLDLFAGIGGFRSGMEKEGHECVGYVEWDKHARKSYENMYDTKGEWTRNDITEITNDEWKELRGKVDVICGGFPCQAFSVAGKRGGFNDARGTMFFEIARATKQIKPRLLFLENVKGLLSHDKGNTFATILNTLDELGYDVEWQLLNSKDFSTKERPTPQNRERVFIIGHLRGSSGRKIFPISEISRSANINEIGTTKSKNAEGTNCRHWVHDVGGSVGALSATDYKQPKQIIRAVLTPNRLDKRQNGRRFKNDGEPMFTLTSQDIHGIAIKEATGKGYTLATVGDSVNYTYPNSETRRGRVGKQIAQTLQAGEVNQGTVTSDMRIRKLTPKECFRLQGFTDEQFYKAEEVNSNSQLYKQAGNSVTVNVIQAIAERL